MKMKKLEVRDGRAIAKFLVKTELKKPLFDMLFPQDNPNMPKTWLEMREHLQNKHKMKDADFLAYKESVKGNLDLAKEQYASDFPNPKNDLGQTLVDVVLDVFAEDKRYDALIDFASYMFEEQKETIESMSFNELVDLIKQLMKESGFLELLQPSEPVTPNTDTPLEA